MIVGTALFFTDVGPSSLWILVVPLSAMAPENILVVHSKFTIWIYEWRKNIIQAIYFNCRWGFCGATNDHCTCDSCSDYRLITIFAVIRIIGFLNVS